MRSRKGDSMMEKKLTYAEIKRKLETGIQQAKLLPEREQIAFVTNAFVSLFEQYQAGLLNQAEYQDLSRNISAFSQKTGVDEELQMRMWDSW
jgi:hypothetical protein